MYGKVLSNFSEDGRTYQHGQTILFSPENELKLLLSEKQLLQIARYWLGTERQYRSVGDMHGVS
jgi:hypothetical protein